MTQMPELFYCDSCERYEDAPLIGQVVLRDGELDLDTDLRCNECNGPVRKVEVTS